MMKNKRLEYPVTKQAFIIWRCDNDDYVSPIAGLK
jgi:hypothetical protein